MKNAKRILTTSPQNNKIFDSGAVLTENNGMLSEEANEQANIILEKDFMLLDTSNLGIKGQPNEKK